jgi:transposase
MAIEEVSLSGKRYTDEFKIEAVRQVTEHGRRVVEVALQDPEGVGGVEHAARGALLLTELPQEQLRRGAHHQHRFDRLSRPMRRKGRRGQGRGQLARRRQGFHRPAARPPDAPHPHAGATPER